MAEAARRTFEKDRLYNVGVIGKSGSGKSTFINAFYGFPHKDEYAAETDVIECTKDAEPYNVPGNDVVLWDVPGFATEKFRDDEDYIKKINFKNYDFYLLLSCSKIDEFEVLLHNEIAKQGKRYFYVRTKFFNELRNERRGHPRTFSEESVKENITKQIKDSFPDTPVYFVDSLKPDLYDFQTLQTLIKEGARFSLSSYRDVQRQGEYFSEGQKRGDSCSIQ